MRHIRELYDIGFTSEDNRYWTRNESDIAISANAGDAWCYLSVTADKDGYWDRITATIGREGTDETAWWTFNLDGVETNHGGSTWTIVEDAIRATEQLEEGEESMLDDPEAKMHLGSWEVAMKNEATASAQGALGQLT